MPPSNKDATGSPPNANDPNHRDTHHKPGDDQGNGAGAGGGGSGGGVIGQGIGQQQLRDDVTHKGVKETNSMQMSGQNIGGANKPPGLSQAHEGWNAWEMEKMEELLGETRGHLGQHLLLRFPSLFYAFVHELIVGVLLFSFLSRLPNPIPRSRRPRKQLPLQLFVFFTFPSILLVLSSSRLNPFSLSPYWPSSDSRSNRSSLPSPRPVAFPLQHPN
jgi:hypothetical protein